MVFLTLGRICFLVTLNDIFHITFMGTVISCVYVICVSSLLSVLVPGANEADTTGLL